MSSLSKPIAAVAVVQVALGLFAAHAYLTSHNTLHNNGRWTSIKTTLDGGIIGAQSFVFNLQGLARGRLNLGEWFGYQEVVSNRLFDPSAIELDLFVSGNAHLTVQFGRSEQRYTGIRVSSEKRFPPALVVATPAGEFLEKRAFRQLRRARPGRVHRLRIELDAEKRGSFSVYLNGKKLRSFRDSLERPMRVGFRGSARTAFVDNIEVTERDGSVWREDFERPANWRSVFAVSVAGALLGSLLLFQILRRALPISKRHLLLFFLMFSLVLLVVSVLYVAFVWRRSEFYPNASRRLEERQAAYADAGAERMLERVRRRAEPTPASGVQRIFFIGSSQTRGSGAAAASDTLAAQAERLLNERAGRASFECLNVAVRAYSLGHMRRDLEQHWVDWGPALAIVNAGYNDRSTSTEEWERELWALIAAAEGADIRLVFIPEASSVARPWPALERIHGATRQIARRAQVPVIEMHPHLQARADDGFLWWDWVHLTSFGQRVFAEYLVDELLERELLALPGPDADAAQNR